MLRLKSHYILRAVGSLPWVVSTNACCRHFWFVGPTAMADVKHVPPTEAAELLKTGYTYLDVRTPEEFAAGHAEGAVNIPFMLSKPEGMVPNAEFVQQVKQHFPNQDHPMVVGCKAGPRSTRACAALAQDYTSLVMNATGWDGWVAASLPAAK
ncbi:hypothetical protein OEZ86_009564 [Tetradesmus obliquus]|uniref:Rhodanese domain-containing protein n=1 Tax=Tetradesmus obliquus TaxID=3088 RepID=A0ABY8USP4_TETOB|nr:hypothetical protein OEZ85_001009 [Tetradesmus obliquus]WIA43031.1 hypothetical protein OEZ86_009564 [Tetradesmus obliquus]